MFHIKLKYLREKANMTRDDLANSLNLTYSTIANYEKDQRQPDFETLKRISVLFNVSTDYLLDVPNVNKFNKTELKIYFEAIKSVINEPEDIYFNGEKLNNTSKNFIIDSIDYISNQIININDGDD